MTKFGGDIKEEVYITYFVRKSFIRLALLDVKEFVCEGSTQPMVTKVQARNITHSLKSWMLEKSDRKMLYEILRVIELLHKEKMTGAFKKLIRSDKFYNGDKESVAKMVDLLTKKDGIERKKNKK